MQKMRDGVVALNGVAAIGVDRDSDRFTGFGRATFADNGAMHEDITALDRVLDRELAHFGSIMSGDVEPAMVADLAAHLRVARRSIQNDVDLARLLSGEDCFNNGFRFKKIVPEKFGGSDLQILILNTDRFLFLRRARTGPLLLHQLFESSDVNR